MQILIYSYNYAPEPIGIAPLMTELAEGLVQQGHQVRVITAMPNYPERRIYPAYRGQLYCTEQHNGVTIQRCYVTVRPKPGLIARILLDASFVVLSFMQALRGWRPDIILSTSPSLPVCVPVALLRWFYGCPSVLNLQDILPEAAVETGLLSNKLAIRIFEGLEKFAYHSASQISVITEGFRANLRSKGVPNQKMVHIPNWVDVNFIRPLPKQPNAFRTAHGLTDKFVVLYSGNIARTQGIRTAIRAAQKLMAYPDIAVVIVGDANQLGELQTLSQDLGVNNITFLPFVPRAELPELLAAADVGLILQKRNVVGFNMPSKTQVLLASGRPIIASVPANGTAAQAVEASGGGIVVTPEHPTALANAILKLYHHPAVAEQLGKQGRQFALDNYSFAASLERYETLFNRLVNAQSVLPQEPETITVK